MWKKQRQQPTWDNRATAANRAIYADAARLEPSGEASEWTPAFWKENSHTIRQIADQFEILWPVVSGEYSPGAFTEVLLRRSDRHENAIAVHLYGVDIGLVPDMESERIMRRLRRFGGRAGAVCVPARLWVSSRGDWGLSVTA